MVAQCGQIAKRMAAFTAILLAAFLSAGCSIKPEENTSLHEEEVEIEVEDVHNENDGFSSYDGGVSTVVLRGTGTLVSSDPESMTATIAIDDAQGVLSGQEVVFDFSKHTASLPVQLDMVQPGDGVTVTYFYSTNAQGYLSGESLVLGRN